MALCLGAHCHSARCQPCQQVPNSCGSRAGSVVWAVSAKPGNQTPHLRKQRKLSLFSALFNNQRSALFIQGYNWNDNSDIHCASSETHS